MCRYVADMPGSVGKIAGCTAILAAVGLLSFGLPAINDEIPSQRLISATEPYGIGLGVEVTPPTHTVVDARGTAPATNLVLFIRDGVEYRLRASPYPGTAATLADALRGDLAHARGAQAVGPGIALSTAHGVPGVTARFEESDAAGLIAAFVNDGVGVDVLVSGTDQGMIANADDILDSVATLRFGARH
jgi:hypothetical protein